MASSEVVRGEPFLFKSWAGNERLDQAALWVGLSVRPLNVALLRPAVLTNNPTAQIRLLQFTRFGPTLGSWSGL